MKDKDNYIIPIDYKTKRYIVIGLTGIFILWGCLIFNEMSSDFKNNPEIFILNESENNFTDVYDIDLISNFKETPQSNCECKEKELLDYIFGKWFKKMLSPWISFFGFVLIIKFILFLEKDFMKRLGDFKK